jgi:hypothetical protein
MRPLFFSLQPPRHPLARFALGLAGLVLLGLFGLIGLLIAAVALAGYAFRRLWLRLSGAPPAARRPRDPDVIEGEFRVVEQSQLPR